MDGAIFNSSVEVDSKSRRIAAEKNNDAGEEEEKVQDDENAQSLLQELQDLKAANAVAVKIGIHKGKGVSINKPAFFNPQATTYLFETCIERSYNTCNEGRAQTKCLFFHLDVLW